MEYDPSGLISDNAEINKLILNSADVSEDIMDFIADENYSKVETYLSNFNYSPYIVIKYLVAKNRYDIFERFRQYFETFLKIMGVQEYNELQELAIENDGIRFFKLFYMENLHESFEKFPESFTELSVKNNSMEILRFLMTSKLDILMEAIQQGKIKVVKEFFDLDIINDIYVKTGETPLTLSAYKNSDILKYLLDNGADVNVENLDGKTALDIAIDNSDYGIVKSILLYNPVVEIYDFADTKGAIRLKLIEYYTTLNIPKLESRTIWMDICNRLDSFRLEELKEISKKVGLPIFESKKVLCKNLQKHYEHYTKEKAEVIYEHPNLNCKNDTDLFGTEWKYFDEDEFIVDQNDYCFSLEDISTIMKNEDRETHKNPYTNIPLDDLKTKDGEEFLKVFKNLDVGSVTTDIHDLFPYGTPELFFIKLRFANLLDNNIHGERNYFDIQTLDILEEKLIIPNVFISELKNEQLLTGNRYIFRRIYQVIKENIQFDELLNILSDTIMGLGGLRTTFIFLLIEMIKEYTEN